MSTLLETYPVVSSQNRAGHFSRDENEFLEKRTSDEEERINKILRSPVPVRPPIAGLVVDESYEKMREASMEIMQILLNETSSDSYESVSTLSSSSDDLQDGYIFEGMEIEDLHQINEEDDNNNFLIMKNQSTSRLRFTFGNHSPPYVKSDSSYLLSIRPPTRSDNPLPYNESFFSNDNSDKEGAEIGLFTIM